MLKTNALAGHRRRKSEVSSHVCISLVSLMAVSALVVLSAVTLEATSPQVQAVNAPVLASNGGSGSSSSNGGFPAAPTGLTGNVDTNSNMNLMWPSVTGATSYIIDRETVSSGAWQPGYATATTNSYQDPAASYTNGTGFRYQVRAIGTNGSSVASNIFPPAQFAVIDLGRGNYPIAINNLGSVEMATNSYPLAGVLFWKNGTNYTLPFVAPGPLNNNDQIVGFKPGGTYTYTYTDSNNQSYTYTFSDPLVTQYFTYTWIENGFTQPGTYAAAVTMPSIWSYANKSSIDVPHPNNEIDTGGALAPIGTVPPVKSLPFAVANWYYFYQPVGLRDDGSLLIDVDGFNSYQDISYPAFQDENDIYETINYSSQGVSTGMSTALAPFAGLEDGNVISWPRPNIAYGILETDPKSGVSIGTQTTLTTTPSIAATTVPCYIINSTVTPLSSGSAVSSVNSLGEVLGESSTGATTNWNTAASTTNLFLTNAPPGQWNAQHQVISATGTGYYYGDYDYYPGYDFGYDFGYDYYYDPGLVNPFNLNPLVFWQQGINYNLRDLVPDHSGYLMQSSAAINDSGAIVGIAIKDENNDGRFNVGLTSTGEDAGPDHYHAVMLLPAELAVDANRDGTIVMANDASNPANVDSHGNPLPVDTTSQTNPYRFWLNNNEDQSTSSIEFGTSPVTVPPTPSSEDFLSNFMVSSMDLEDWTRLWIYTKGLNAAINSGAIRVGLKWNSTNGSTPGIKLVTASDADGGTEYLSDTTGAAATAQVGPDTNDPNNPPGGGQKRLVIADANDGHTSIVPTGAAADFVFPQWVWHALSDANPKTFFLFEGTSRGTGQLQIVFLKSDGTTLLGSGGNLWLDIRDIKEMYQRAIASVGNSDAGPSPNPPAEPYTSTGTFNDSPNSASLDTNNPFVAPVGETSQCVVFVHGWFTDWNGFTDYSERFFKRLWWQGYKGRFIGFTWPALSGVETYNPSEWNAWLYGRSFMNYVNGIKGNYTNFTVAAHSQGNVVVGSAIQEGLTIPNYILLEAALPTGCYTTNNAYNQYQKFLTAEQTTATPDFAVNLGYRGFDTPAYGNVGQYYCFFNPQDYALATGTALWGTLSPNWEANEVTYKPNAVPGGDGFVSYAMSNGAPVLIANANGSVFHNVTDVHESMSFVARPRSQAVGADTNSANVFANSTDLHATYGFATAETDHSGQFLRNYNQVYQLYHQFENIVAPTP